MASKPIGGVHVSYTDRPGRTLRYAYRAPAGGWTVAVVDGESLAMTSDLAVDSRGGAHIVYWAGEGFRGLRYAHSRRCP